jgi:magnesium transporter
MSALINQAAENDNVSTIFVIENDKFYGTIELRDLIIARSNQNMDDIIKTSYPRVYAKTLIEDCISDLSDYQLDSIPVLDADDKLLGVITLADIVETVEEELTEDYARLGGVSEEEEISTGIFKTVWMRLPWLIALLFLSLLVSVLLSSFESVISVLPAIVFFQSMILGMAGNGGTQSLAVTIRTISDDNDDKTLIKAILKEIRVGFINGLALGALSFVVILAFLVLKQQEIIQNAGYNFDDALKAAMIVGSSLIVAMTFASLVGSVVPILLSKLKIDPAVASGPFITTINDILAILIYYGLAFVLFISVF